MSSEIERLLTQDRPLQFALLWDVPRLRATGQEGVEAFISAMGPPPFPDLEGEGPKGALGIAAAGISAERSGDGQKAVDHYAQIKGTFWKDLFRHCLLGWSTSVEGTADVQEAADLVGRLSHPSDTRSLLAVKLATFAYDKGDAPLFERLLEDAIRSSRSNTRLRFVLQIEALNLLGRPPGDGKMRGSVRGLPESRLTDRDWIDGWSLEGAQEHLFQALTDHARDPWSTVVRAGQRPLDRVVAAELQATWAGAQWQRRPLRKQLGAQLLLGNPRTPSEAAQGLWHWVMGGGRDYQSVGSLAEPVLDRPACDWLMRALASRVGPGENTMSPVAQLATVFWDCISDELLRPLLDFLPVSTGDHPLIADNRRAWALVAVREPAVFEERFVKLEESVQLAFAGALSERAIERLSDTVASRMQSLLIDKAGTQRTHQEWVTKLLLDQRLSQEGATLSLNTPGVSPETLVVAAQINRTRVDDSDLARAIAELAGIVAKQRADAHEGRIGIGTSSPADSLARAVGVYGPAPDAVETLWESALDASLPGALRLEALGALAGIANEGHLSPDRTGELRDSTMSTSAPDFVAVSTDLLRAAGLLVFASDLTDEDEIELIGLSRSRDGRARELAVNAASLGSTAGDPSERLEYVLVTALFDPNDGVVNRGITAMAERGFPVSVFERVVEGRLLELMRERGKRTRLAAVRAADVLMKEKPESRLLREILALGRDDKSWSVAHSLDVPG